MLNGVAGFVKVFNNNFFVSPVNDVILYPLICFRSDWLNSPMYVWFGQTIQVMA